MHADGFHETILSVNVLTVLPPSPPSNTSYLSIGVEANSRGRRRFGRVSPCRTLSIAPVGSSGFRQQGRFRVASSTYSSENHSGWSGSQSAGTPVRSDVPDTHRRKLPCELVVSERAEVAVAPAAARVNGLLITIEEEM